MKEGLRSGKLKAQKDNVFLKQRAVEKNGNEVKREGSDSGGKKIPHLVSSGLEESKKLFLVDRYAKESGELGSEECGEDGDMGESENVRVAEVGNKRRRVDNGEEIDDNGLEEKIVKEDEVDGKMQIGGRVLRSRVVVNGGSDKTESDGVMVGKSRGSDGSHKKCSVVRNEGGDQLGTGFTEKLKGKRGRPPKVDKEESDQLVGGFTEKLKGKRGRPPKVDKEASDQLVGGFTEKLKGKRGRPPKVNKEGSDLLVGGFTEKLKGKRGRPPKVDKEESDQSGGGLKKKKKLKRKRGRPRNVEKEERNLLDSRLRKKSKFEHMSSLKVQGSNGVLKGNYDKEGNVGFKAQERTKMITNGSNPERINGKGQYVKTFSPAKRDKKGKDLETEDNEDGEGNTKRKQKEKGSKEWENKQKEQDAEPSRKELKESVRDKIVELLLSAGWTIQHRPRNGREYHDAVYVSPEGKTHWSVTLAYNVLKRHCENGDVNSVVCKTGFKFTPLPPEEVSMLTRIVVNKREGKKKGKKKGKGGNTADGVIEEKGKKRLGKSLKGKHLLLKKDDSESTACKGMLSLVQGRKQQKTKYRKRCALLVRNSENADSENDGYIQYDGKRTVLAWMIDLGTISLNSKVKYMNRRKTRVLLEGRITRDGIHCGCCKEILSISKFEIHAKSDYCEPFKHIYLESGSLLLQCLLDSWNKQEESESRGFHYVDVNSEDPNDDTCGICGDGGDLICCDGCPSTFHQSCLEIKKFPSGDWHCVYCSCKFCGLFSGNTGQRNDNVDIVASALLTCHLCEEKYHQSCVQVKDAVNEDSSRLSFCGKNCQELFEKLQMLVGVRREMEEGFSMTLIRRSDVSSNVSLCDTPQKVDCNSKLIESNSKLAVAFLIMDECFLPMVDHRSGVNLIHNILYNRGSNFNRLNYSGFFTAILERGDEIISAASIRIHGNYLAEMPFIGTRYMYRRQGMCRRLLTAIESALSSLNVERLVIPAISELRETWTAVFGFKLLEESSKQKMKNINILVFPGVDILQKPLLKQLTEANSVEGLRSTEHEHHQTVLEVLCDTDERHLAGTDCESTAPNGNETNDELAAVESNTQLLCGVPNDNLEEENNTITVPSGSMCDVHEQTEDINEYQNSDSVPDVRVVEVDTQQNQQSMSEVESKSFMSCHTHPEATDSGIKTLCAFREGTESVDYEVRIADDIVKNLNSLDEGSICNSTENNATELQNVALVDDLKVSGEDIVCHDSETTTQIYHDARDLTCHDSQHFQVAGPISCPDGRMLETCEVEYNHSAAQHTPILMDEVHPESIKDCHSKILTNSKASNDLLHPTSPLAHQKADDFKDHCTNLPVGCSISCSLGSGSDSHEVASAPADSISHLSCNGISKPPVVADVDLTSNGSQMNTNSLKQSELDSQVDNSSVTQCNSSNTSVMAIHCASGGGKSCGGGTSDAMILSNQAS